MAACRTVWSQAARVLVAGDGEKAATRRSLDGSTGALRPRYGWYPEALVRLRRGMSRLDGVGASALVHLDSLAGSQPVDSRIAPNDGA